jgi:hypothetical protein
LLHAKLYTHYVYHYLAMASGKPSGTVSADRRRSGSGHTKWDAVASLVAGRDVAQPRGLAAAARAVMLSTRRTVAAGVRM